MWKWIKRRLQNATGANDSLPSRLLALQSEAQRLTLELAELKQQWLELKRRFERQENMAEARACEALATVFEHFLHDAAASITQLTTQAHLIESEGRKVAANDVLAVAMRLIRLFEEMGLERKFVVNATAPFDPEWQEPLSAQTAFSSGQPVTVRFVAISYRGKVLRKAKVEQTMGG